MDEVDLYSLAQYYANKHSDSELRKIISQKINRLPKSNELLNYLLEIGFNNIWTTNYDKLIEKALEKKVFSLMLKLGNKNWASLSSKEHSFELHPLRRTPYASFA